MSISNFLERDSWLLEGIAVSRRKEEDGPSDRVTKAQSVTESAGVYLIKSGINQCTCR